MFSQQGLTLSFILVEQLAEKMNFYTVKLSNSAQIRKMNNWDD